MKTLSTRILKLGKTIITTPNLNLKWKRQEDRFCKDLFCDTKNPRKPFIFVTQLLPVVPTKNRKTIFIIDNPSDFGSLFDSFIKQNSLAYTFSVRIPLLGQIDVSIDSLLPDGAHKTHPISSCPSKIAETREHFRNLEMFDIYSDGRVRLCKIYRRWKSPSPYNFIHVFPDSDT